MMKIKYQIFISSTFQDLKKEREQIIKCILEMGHIPVGMEMFSAANEEQWRVIQRQIDDCDYYIVITAHRYGSLDGNLSYTEKEYDYAIEKGIPVLGFVIDDSVSWPPEQMENEQEKRIKLINFKEKIKQKLVSFWKNDEDLYGKAAIALNKAINTYSRPGYIRATDLPNNDLYNELSRLSSENSHLRQQIEEAKNKIINKQRDDQKELVHILRSNKLAVSVWFDGDSDWTRGFELTLLDIFESISVYLIDEASFEKIQQAIAAKASKRADYRSTSPVPRNRTADWLSDLYTLDLIIPSTKKHAPSDKTEYWTLSEKGRALSKDLRKIKLFSGIQETKDDDDKENN